MEGFGSLMEQHMVSSKLCVKFLRKGKEGFLSGREHSFYFWILIEEKNIMIDTKAAVGEKRRRTADQKQITGHIPHSAHSFHYRFPQSHLTKSFGDVN